MMMNNSRGKQTNRNNSMKNGSSSKSNSNNNDQQVAGVTKASAATAKEEETHEETLARLRQLQAHLERLRKQHQRNRENESSTTGKKSSSSKKKRMEEKELYKQFLQWKLQQTHPERQPPPPQALQQQLLSHPQLQPPPPLTPLPPPQKYQQQQQQQQLQSQPRYPPQEISILDNASAIAHHELLLEEKTRRLEVELEEQKQLTQSLLATVQLQQDQIQELTRSSQKTQLQLRQISEENKKQKQENQQQIAQLTQSLRKQQQQQQHQQKQQSFRPAGDGVDDDHQLLSNDIFELKQVIKKLESRIQVLESDNTTGTSGTHSGDGTSPTSGSFSSGRQLSVAANSPILEIVAEQAPGDNKRHGMSDLKKEDLIIHMDNDIGLSGAAGASVDGQHQQENKETLPSMEDVGKYLSNAQWIERHPAFELVRTHKITRTTSSPPQDDEPLGFEMGHSPDGNLEITKTTPGGLAVRQTDLRPGCEILSINGVNCEPYMLISDAMSRLNNGYQSVLIRAQVPTLTPGSTIQAIVKKETDHSPVGVVMKKGEIISATTGERAKPQIVNILKDSPAYHTRLCPGLIVEKINGTSTTGLSLPDVVKLIATAPAGDVIIETSVPAAGPRV